MNPVLKFLAGKGKGLMAKVISTEETAHPLPDDLIYIDDLDYVGSDGASLAADVYRPKDTSADPLPIAVFVHGGGLFVGSRKANRTYFELLAERGYVVFAPEYRLIDKADAMGEISDVCAGLSFMKALAADLGGDLSRVLVDRKSTRLNSSHPTTSRMPSSA